ncbi:MAG TPA: DUF4124 domain-containing protein [Dyella sp.]|nr:DUF4124 domain-containing protein [Dyella sp.]
MRKALIIITAAGLGFAGLAQAQRAGAGSSVQYRWHDAKGLAHYSDSLSVDAIANGYDVVNSQGLVMRHVDRPLSASERAAAKKLAVEAAARKREQEQRQREDQQMLAAYPDEAQFVAAQHDELTSIDQQIATTRASLATQEKALADLLDRAGELERAKQPVPKFLSDKIAAQRNVVGSQRALLDRLLASYATTQLKNEAQLQRYRQLRKQLPQADEATAGP